MGPKLSRIGAIAGKELRQLARDRLTFAMIVGIPLMQMLLFGYAINFDVRGLRAGVADEANTTQSRALIAALAATQVMDIELYAPSAQVLRQKLAQNVIKIGIVIPADFERRRLDGDRPVAQVLVDGSEPSLENMARGLANMPATARPGQAQSTTPLLEVRIEYNPEKRTAVQIVPGLIGVILSMTMMMFTAVSIVRERERGNLEFLITTPATPAELMIGKLMPYVLIGLVQTTLILSVGAALFAVPVSGSLVDLYLAALLFIAATLALGLVISTLAKTQAQAFQMSLFFMLPSILLSGFMFPFDGMPRAAQWLAQILPLTHFNVLIRGVVLRGVPLLEMTAQLWKLMVCCLAALAVASFRFRKRLD